MEAGREVPVISEARRPAYHESGHALAARLLGLPVFSIAVDPPETHHGYAGPDDDASLRDHLTVKLGGIAAEYMAGYVRVIRGGTDLREAARLASRLTPDPHEQLQAVADALQRAIALLTEHPAALRELARSAAARGSIVGQDSVNAALDGGLEYRDG